MSEPVVKRRRVELALSDKIKLIRASETNPKPTLKALSSQFGVGKSTVGDILKRKAVYEEEYERTGDGNKCRVVCQTKYGRINDLLWQWFSQARAKNIPLSGPILQEKAIAFALELGIDDFKGSNGWLSHWKAQHNIKGFKVSGESAGVDMELVENYQQRIPDIVRGYSADDIFNCDETGLYFRALPDRTLSVKGESSKGIKSSKERVTLMFACSSTGEKLQPLVIGKSKKPRCFKNIDLKKLPVQYTANKKAWMTSTVFSEWITNVNKVMKRQGRQIIMFLDNATSHTKDMQLSNVTLKFLPANTTSVLQPLDHGIIQAFKARYRKHMLQSLLSKIDRVDNAQTLCKEITLLDCLHWIGRSWAETTPSTISKCFCSTGFAAGNDISDEDDNNDEGPTIHELATELNIELDVNFDSQIPIEDDSDEWEKVLVDQFRDSPLSEDEQEDLAASSDDEISPGSDMTYEDVLGLVQKIKNFAVVKDDQLLLPIQELQILTEKAIAKNRCKQVQSSINSYFKPV